MKTMTVKQLIDKLRDYGDDTIIVVGQPRHDYCNQIDGEYPRLGDAYLTDSGTLVNGQRADRRLDNGDDLTEVIVIGACPDYWD